MRLLMFLLLGLPMFLSAQSIERTSLLDASPGLLMRFDSLEMEYRLEPQMNYEVGTSVFANFDGFYGFNTYVAPKFVFQPTKKWIVDGGLVLGRTQMYNVPYLTWGGDAQQMDLDQTILTMGAYVRGTYLVNEKLYIGGTGFVTYNHIESSIPYANRNAYHNITGETFVGYKFSDSFKVEASFSVDKSTPRNSFNYFAY